MKQTEVIAIRKGDLTHALFKGKKQPKYIDKKFKNGKWVYYYDDYKNSSSAKTASNSQKYHQQVYDNFAKKHTKSTDRLVKGSSTYDKDGGFGGLGKTTHEATYYTDDLFGSTHRGSTINGVAGTTTTKIRRVGKVGQAFIKGKANLKKSVKKAKKQIKKGQKFLKKLFK